MFLDSRSPSLQGDRSRQVRDPKTALWARQRVSWRLPPAHSMTLSAGILDARFQKRQRSIHRFAQCRRRSGRPRTSRCVRNQHGTRRL